MEIFKFNILPTEEFNKREEFRKAINNCEICGSALEFSYQQLETHAVLQEDAHCPCCEYKKVSSHHRVN